MAFLANPTARFQQYVSPSGSASGPGGATTPWQTIDQGIAAVPTTCSAVGGQTGTLQLVGTAASPNTYVSTAGITVNGTLTIKPATEALGAKVAGNGTTQSILLATGANLTLQDIILDPSLNNGGAAAVGITVPATAATLNLTCTRVTFQNWTDRAISGAGTARINYTQTDCVLNGGNVNGGVYFASHAAGAITLSGGSITLTSQKLAGTGGGVIVIGSALSTFTATDVDTDITIDPTLLGAGVHYGMRVLNIPGADMNGGTHSISGVPGSRVGACLFADYNSTNSIAGSRIRNATGTNSTNGGYVFGFGLEGSGTPSQADGCSILDNVASATGAAIAGGCHLTFMGFTQNGFVQRNTLTDGGLSIVDKDSIGTTVSANVLSGFNSSGIRAKGTTNCTYSGNTVTQTASYTAATIIDLSWDDVSTVPTTGAIVTANTFANAGGSGTSMLILDNHAGSMTPSNNVYNQSSGSLATHPWVRLGVNYDTLAAWQAIEPTATGNAP